MRIPQFQNVIWDWHKQNRRDLPWRNTNDPYAIMVSEIMLQQTQVSRVLAKYAEFLDAFPALESLARAPQRKLLKVWAGLGYWRRALYLQQAAKIIVKKYGGKFPRDPKTLEQLPGIGHYTARAIACFAFNTAEAFLDTNIRRVYIHFFFSKRKNVADKEILALAKRALRKQEPKEWHYALFDYGALALKDKKINRRSRHYAKQKKFEGSFRFFRTKIMRFLLEQPNQKATVNKITRMIRKEESPYAAEKLLASLRKDGLIKKRGHSYSL